MTWTVRQLRLTPSPVSVWYDRLWALGRWLDEHKTKNQNLQVLAQTVVDQTIGVLAFFPLYFYAYEISEALVSSRGRFTLRMNVGLANMMQPWSPPLTFCAHGL